MAPGKAAPLPAQISNRALNRATLARQHLLAPATLTVPELVSHLVGLQAQTPHTWYVGLWARLKQFAASDAADLLASRQLVRIALMRSTIHLVTASDCLALRPLMQAVPERVYQTNWQKNLPTADMSALIAAGRAIVEEAPRTNAELTQRLSEQWPDIDKPTLVQLIRTYVPLVQVPPRGLWGRSGPIAHTSAEHWLGAALDPHPDPAAIALRYFGAFGPASLRDLQLWCGLTNLAPVVEKLRPQLLTFRNDKGQELFDLPDAPRPDPDTPAPVRFLYDFDNLFLSHADRRRVITERGQQLIRNFSNNGLQPAQILVDGVTAAHWTIQRDRKAATLTVQPYDALTTADTAAITTEGARLLAFTDPTLTHDIQILPPLPV